MALFARSDYKDQITILPNVNIEKLGIVHNRTFEFFIYKKKHSWIKNKSEANPFITFKYNIDKFQGTHWLHFYDIILHGKQTISRSICIGGYDCLPKKTLIKHLIKSII